MLYIHRQNTLVPLKLSQSLAYRSIEMADFWLYSLFRKLKFIDNYIKKSKIELFLKYTEPEICKKIK